MARIGNKKVKSKAKAGASTTEVKVPTKGQYIPSKSLSWKPVKTSAFSGMDAGGGMMMLEELEDVGIEWEEAQGGQKVAKFIEVEGKKKKGKKAEVEEPEEDVVFDEDFEEEASGDGQETGEEDAASNASEEFPDFAGFDAEDLNEADDEEHEELECVPDFNDDLLPEWSSVPLHPTLKRAFLATSFTTPTTIQSRALPAALTGRDVIGVAETGSGKTLAYSLPMLDYLLRRAKPVKGKKRALKGLVLCPTRELALQVVEHLEALLKHTVEEEDEEEDEVEKKKGEGKEPPRISIGSVVGGLSAHKQTRILNRGCDILVATPGRLWDLMKGDDELATSIRTLRFLVIDEADRMIENGHFQELESIVRLTQRSGGEAGPDDDDPVFQSLSTIFEASSALPDMQTFIFSATLSKDLQINLKKRGSWKKNGKKKRSSTLEDLVEKLDFRDETPEIIDLSPEGGVVATLRESMIECTKDDKDLYLYYFLLRFPGRSLIFVNSIDAIRRLLPLLNLLQLPIFPLHSQLQQKQRLKNLERFKSNANGVLIATDVASRGLDIPQVDHVVHFNLPRTADAYIHRSGRTARAKTEGFALLLVSADEKPTQRALNRSLNRTHELPELPVEAGFLPPLRARLKLANDIEKAIHRAQKRTHEKNWLLDAAEAMDLDIDPTMLSDGEDDPDAPYHKAKKMDKAKGKTNLDGKVDGLKMELRELLKEKLVARGVSTRYPTSGSKVIVDDLIKSTGHGMLLGASTSKAYDEVESTGKRKKIGGGARPLKKKVKT
ncbi:ATP-dependent RNA helicase MAK5 [Cryptococcus amylolentus CBS 6039]|uniref:RNA helicase n=2 Tax=Cryptococcus amylolentus CBS 6039 TaxID=1295533 RepID=A0A1E3HN57_9TREE|nr:ATP-dependent RNA helicase MAK5 [Cryptococcus amylolentus CBS 6039]ODN77156.1 ATP-dependent RNA helicase MAK5 [Cryptococcus amylolentus CBS 6039]